MKNQELFSSPPDSQRILNQGVAELAERTDEEYERVLRYELKTFICEGQYKKGLEKIFSQYLGALASNAAEQKGVWISGFYGSGKTHLAKMLRVLWTDFRFADGSTARGIVHLPDDVHAQLKELSKAAERNGGGLFAASGKMGGGGSASVRLTVLSIICRAKGLPDKYTLMRFLLWLRDEGKLEQVRAVVERQGRVLEREIENLFVSPIIAQALREAFPGAYQSDADVRQALRANFSQPTDISDEELVSMIARILEEKGKFPLTVLVLDELQQYIGTDADKAYQVQLVTEACTKRFKSRLLIVGTGQSALNDTPNLSRLLGRFPEKVQLSENDVDRVIRRIILAKKPSAEHELKAELDKRHGEIARHLEGSTVAHTAADDKDLCSDYPLLPTRRRFWEQVLRTIDPTGTTAQVRNQLRVVNEAVVAVQDKDLGYIVGGDFIFDQNAESLVASQAIDRETYTRILELSGSAEPEERLMGRILKLVFLINKLPSQGSADAKLRATAQAVSDLLIENLGEDSADLRRRVPSLLDALVHRHALMQIEGDRGAEYRLQTRESAEWYDEYRSQESALRSSASSVHVKRTTLLRERFEGETKNLCFYHGQSREARKPELRFDPSLPADYAKRLYIWVRDGATLSEAQALTEARGLDRSAPTIIVYLPDENSNELFNAIVAAEAARTTITLRGSPGTPAGQEARKSIETRLNGATTTIEGCLGAVIAAGRVWMAGGSEVANGIGLKELLEQALATAVARLYSQFKEADHKAWEKVVVEAKKGNREALQALSWAGEPGEHPVCRSVLDLIGSQKTGKDIRDSLGAPPYGWSKDAIDGALLVLLATERLVATDSTNHTVSYSAQTLDRAKIGQCLFKREDRPLSANDRVAICSLYQQLGVSCKPSEVQLHLQNWQKALRALLEKTGGEAPLPMLSKPLLLTEIEGLMGNDQLFRILDKKAELEALIKASQSQAVTIAGRLPRWQLLQGLLAKADGYSGLDHVRAEAAAIVAQRSLASESNPVESLLASACDTLRATLNEKSASCRKTYQHFMTALSTDPDWQRLSEPDRAQLMAAHSIGPVDAPNLSGPEAILASLSDRPPKAWDDLIDAVPGRFEKLRKDMIALLVPKAVPLSVPKRLINNEAELESWLAELRAQIKAKLAQGPVSLS